MKKTRVMGIINVTDDSFYDKSRHTSPQDAIAIALQMQADGADLLDIGGESTRPGSASVDESEELARVIPVIKAIAKHVSLPISIDTMKPKVAEAAIAAGAAFINDISGCSNPDMVRVAKEYNLPICIMHMQGTPQTMQLNPHYPNGIISHLCEWFTKKIDMLMDAGINPDKIILDPGIGFGKSVADNVEIIHNLPELGRLGFAMLLGASRKSFLGKIVNKPTSELLPATLAAHGLAVISKVDIIRVHDVKEHRDLVDTLSVCKGYCKVD